MDKQEELKKRWDFFQKHHWVSPEFSSSVVFKSWQRCCKHVNPYQWIKPHIVAGYTFNSLLTRHRTTLQVAAIVLEDIYTLSASEPMMLALSDDNGCMLQLEGHPALLEELAQLGLRKGCFWNENMIGTNAVSLCLELNSPVELIMAEHYHKYLHPYAGAAAPFFDLHGKLCGAILLLKRAELYSKESLLIATACAREVELRLHMRSEQLTTNNVLCQRNAVLECMDDGLLAWDENRVITMINLQAANAFNLPLNDTIGKNVHQLIRFSPIILAGIEQQVKLVRKQITVEVLGEFIEALVTLRPLSDNSFLLLIHPLDKIRELAQRQIGRTANITFEDLPAVSKKMRHVITVARRAVKSRVPILLYGEEGVGKLGLAMAIHNESEFKAGPFITLNCGMLHPESMDKEVLGYDEDKGQASKFELAHGGTLYLENIEYLPTGLQSALLKMLKTGLIMRSDSQRLIPVNFQLIASAQSDLALYVSQSRFSRQLYYEISTHEIDIPPLRSRKEDVRFLIDNLLREHGKVNNSFITLEPKALEALVNYSWKGNHSELKNRIEKILLHRKGNVIYFNELPDEIKNNPHANNEEGTPAVLSLDEVERQTIEQAWELYGGKMNEMAKALKIGRTTLWRKINKYGLQPMIS
ncbi:dihydroxyacetone kinase operon transcriptional regulator DhaR [Serratia microhaemolytica]|uniref:dihydroxyacetone kinase operon transcriptional regulator DhaR n=1 Tax=Serratia microhaemolytica TaxID=2675110 RepID=UPI000FDE3034|nr:dihydroxyacetone kinase operon transcriptional regulator DhaR [Serratia microhaemolytica]